MADLGLVALIIFFFVLARGYVAACARLVGGESEVGAATEEPRAAIDTELPSQAHSLALLPFATLGAENWIALAIAVLVLIYLVVALLRPERF